MPTIKDVVAKLGFNIEKDDDFDMEKFEGHFQNTYVPVDAVLKDESIKKKIVGKTLGSLGTKAAQTFGLKAADVEGKPLEEVFALVQTIYAGQIADLTEKATKGNDENVRTLTEELGVAKSERNAAMEGVTQLKAEKEASDKKWSENINAYKLNDKLGKIKSSIAEKLTDDYQKNELVKTGFDSHLASTFIFELDPEKETLLVKDKKSGEYVKSKKNLGQLADPEEVILGEADAKGVLKKNNAPQKKLPETQQQQQRQQNNNNNNEDGPRIHPNALKRTQR